MQALLRNIVFSNVSENPSANPRTVSAQIKDGSGGTSLAVTKTINVTPVNDAPVLGGISGTVGYTNAAPPINIATTGEFHAAGTVSDVDSANFNTGKLTVPRLTAGMPAT